ncbi:hypothetical protein DRQ53_03085 [bacterium]|nr:MAG: hypothetical protein DRQ32_04015 [bacterium]RKZ17584.1 MAG: hypothetical protein DRQ53_03085 [bacterium]
MRAVLILFIICAAGITDSRADQSFEVTADSLLVSEVGSLVRISEPGEVGQTLFAFEEPPGLPVSWIRLYAGRPDDTGEWEVFDAQQFLCPAFSMIAGQTWRFLDSDQGGWQTAEVIVSDMVTVPAGTFPAWRVDVSEDDQPGTVKQRFWFAGNVGIVQQVEFEAGVVVWRSELSSYSVSGNGFFPLVVGNRWEYVEATVPVPGRSLGGFKAMFGN